VEIYLDIVVLLNFLVDLLLILGTNRMAGFPPDWKRSIGAALLGGAYGGVCLLPRFRFLAGSLWRTVSLGGMAVAAFGWNRSAWKRGAVFLILTMALGGIALSLGRSEFPALILGAGGLWLLCRTAFEGTLGGREYVPIQLSYGDRHASLTALRDTGNVLRDPVSGEQVLVIAGEVAGQLTGLTREQLRMPLETLASRPLPGLRLIPYRTVGQGSGMLLALRFRDVRIGSQVRSAVVAFAPEGLGGTEGYQALTGGVL
jgi:stage II sporulation protein GA (sporulation sigma-E factor processing peptidase)